MILPAEKKTGRYLTAYIISLEIRKESMVRLSMKHKGNSTCDNPTYREGRRGKAGSSAFFTSSVCKIDSYEYDENLLEKTEFIANIEHQGDGISFSLLEHAY